MSSVVPPTLPWVKLGAAVVGGAGGALFGNEINEAYYAYKLTPPESVDEHMAKWIDQHTTLNSPIFPGVPVLDIPPPSQQEVDAERARYTTEYNDKVAEQAQLRTEKTIADNNRLIAADPETLWLTAYGLHNPAPSPYLQEDTSNLMSDPSMGPVPMFSENPAYQQWLDAKTSALQAARANGFADVVAAQMFASMQNVSLSDPEAVAYKRFEAEYDQKYFTFPEIEAFAPTLQTAPTREEAWGAVKGQYIAEATAAKNDAARFVVGGWRGGVVTLADLTAGTPYPPASANQLGSQTPFLSYPIGTSNQDFSSYWSNPSYIYNYGNSVTTTSSNWSQDLPTISLNDLYPGGYSFSNSSGSFDTGEPVILDLSGKGISITQLANSNMYFDMAGDGYQQRTAWAGSGNGVLAWDPSGGAVTEANQIEFTLWDPSAKTDMQALEDVFDTNHDGVLNASDTSFDSFRILVTNADGTSTLETLAQAGVTSINLTANAYQNSLPDGSSIDGETTFTKSDGTAGTAATVNLVYDSTDYDVRQTVGTGTSSATAITNTLLNPDGSLAGTVTTVTSADHLTKTTTTADSGGVVVNTQTDTTAVNAGGSTTETLTDKNASGIVLDKTVTDTSADGKTVTIARDTTGSGYTNRLETSVTSTDGSTSVAKSALTRDGTLINKTISNVSADGLTRTVQADSTGNGVNDLTSVDATVVTAAGRTETVTNRNADGSLRSRTVTQTSADFLTTTISTDAAGTGVVNLVNTVAVVNNAGGGVTTTTTNAANDGTKLNQSVVTVSADGMTTTTQTDAAGSGVFNITQVDQVVLDAAGNRTETVTHSSADGTVLDKQVFVHNADGKTGSSETYVNFGSGLKLTHAETRVLNGSDALVDTVTGYNADGVQTNQTITTTSADGLSVITASNIDGNVDYTTASNTEWNADGSSTLTVSKYASNGALINQTVTITSADGLSAVTHNDTNGDGNFDSTVSDITVDHADGSITQAVTTISADGTVLGSKIIDTSADRSMVTTATKNANGQTVLLETNVIAANGVTTNTLQTLAPDGTLIGKTVTTTSANGLSVTTRKDNSGSGVFDVTATDSTVVNANGSRTETVTDTSANGTQIDQTITTTSANGLSSATAINTDGMVDYTATDVKTFNTDGSITETATKYAANGNKISATVTTIAGNGLSKTTQTDVNGDGTFDVIRTDVTVLNADGSTTKTLTNTNADGTLRSRTVTATSANGLNVTTQADHYGLGSFDQITAAVTRADGSVVEAVQNFNRDGSLVNETVTTTSANGLSQTTQTDLDGDGRFDETQADETVINADGSTTQTITSMAGTSAVEAVAITTSANGLAKTASTSIGGTLQKIETVVSVYNPDGSKTQTVAVKSANGTLESNSVTQISTDQKTQVITSDLNGDGKVDQIETIVQRADGCVVDTVTAYAPSGAQTSQTITTTSANGLSKTVTSNIDGQADTTTTDLTQLDADGSRTETVTKLARDSSLVGQTVTTTSANGLSVTTTANQDGKVDYKTADVTVINADGSQTETATQYDSACKEISRTVITTAANGLSKIAQADLTGDGVADLTETDVTILNADGSRKETVTGTNADGSLRSKSVTTSSANGLNVTTQTDTYGLGKNDQVTTQITQANGDVVQTVDRFNQNGAKINETVTTTAANGLSKTTQIDLNGDGIFDNTQTDVTVVNAGGSKTQTVTTLAGTTAAVTAVTTTSADGTSQTTAISIGGALQETGSDVIVFNADGSTTEKVQEKSAGNVLLSNSVTTISADKKTTTISNDLNGDGKIDQVETVVQQEDGSVADTVTAYAPGGGQTSQTVTTTSANGLSKTVTSNIDGKVDSTATDEIQINADGGRNETVSAFANNGSQISQTVTTTSANGLSVTTTVNEDGKVDYKTIDVTAINADGSQTETAAKYDWPAKRSAKPLSPLRLTTYPRLRKSISMAMAWWTQPKPM